MLKSPRKTPAAIGSDAKSDALGADRERGRRLRVAGAGALIPAAGGRRVYAARLRR